MENKKDYKNTLNMGETAFSMKADLVIKEPLYRKKWQDQNIYQLVLEQNKNKPSFVLHDGPPYANGSLHTGHALNKILKDIIIRYKSINNFYTPYIPGWDTHGLPIENKMLAEMNVSHKNISIVELRKKATAYALSQVETQKQQFQQLQLLCDFKKIYRTLDKSYEVKQLEIFKKMCLDGLVYKGLKPVYWSPTSLSALAEAEIEYFEHRSPSIYVKFPIVESDLLSNNDYLLIWTTTPWTLIANSGIAINSQFDYSLVNYNGQNFVVATQLIDKLASLFEWNNYSILKTFKGVDLLKTKYKSIINENVSPVVEGHHVNLETGTGLVHIAPLFGEDDFIIGKKNNLNEIMHINDDGTINELSSQYQGIFYEDANKNIGKWLKDNHYLVKLQFIKHQYPHDWRTKKPIIFRGTPQWFVSITKIKQDILEELKKVQFFSQWGYKRLSDMIEKREDWTISRQRSWGVPIIVFYDENQKPVIEEQLFDHVIDLISQYGSDIWYEKSVDELLPEKYRNKNWTKEIDIMDVWFDSGASFNAVDIESIQLPFDLYLEGSDQYRGWFNSSLINAVAFNKKAPFKQLVSHGFVVDENGKKMSKSLGNGIDPLDIVRTNGAEILRLWVANSVYSSDVAFSNTIINQTSELYRKFRNTIRFCLANLYDYQFENIEVSNINALMMERLNNLKINVKKYYDEYQFINVIKDINNFVADSSSFYMSIIKDILYVEKADSKIRREVQYVLYQIVDFLIIALYPILPTTCEEAYEYFNKENKKESICLEQFFDIKDELKFIEETKWKSFFELKDQINRLIEEKIKSSSIKRSNEAFVKIKTDDQFIKSLDLKMLLMIGKFEFSNETKVEKFDSIKCQRCWNHFEKSQINNDLCPRCFKIVN